MTLLQLIERDTYLKKVAGTHGGEYHGPCPFCGGHDRFIVQTARGRQGKWSCRHCSPRWQDDIAYLMRRDNLPFIEARDRLRPAASSRRPAPPKAPAAPITGPAARHDPGWQAGAQAFVERCRDALQTSAEAQDYLATRGLSLYWGNAQALGWNDRERRETWGDTPVYLARGIVIPWRDGERLLKVNIRRLRGEPKYVQAAGGTNGLYEGELLDADATAVLVEGEFDAISVWVGATSFCLHNQVFAVATGSTTGGRKTASLGNLMQARRVLLAFDADDAGDKAAAWWLARLRGTGVRLRPTRHDVNAMLVAGDDLEAWLAAGLTSRNPAPEFPAPTGGESR